VRFRLRKRTFSNHSLFGRHTEHNQFDILQYFLLLQHSVDAALKEHRMISIIIADRL
jgi:hypothetical protein